MRMCRCLCMTILCIGSLAADWPQWLGPKRNASTSEIIRPWQELKILWRQPVGEGNSGPVVSGGRVFLHTKLADELKEQVAAYGTRSGKLVWQSVYPRPALKTLFGNGPRATPAVQEKHLYALGITGLLTCFDVETGKQVWQVDTAAKFSPPKLTFGVSSSPLIDKDLVVVDVGGRGASIVAFAAGTGDVVWKSLDDRASYSSPIIFGESTNRQLIALTQQGLVSLNPADGELRWRFPFKDLLLESSTTPVHAHKYLLASSITLGSVGLKLASDNQAVVAWKNPNLTCYFSTPVVIGKEFYAVTGVNPLQAVNPFAKEKPKASLACVELESGKKLWSRANVGTYHASLLTTGDHKLLMLEEKGDLVLIEPDRDEYRELARSQVCGQTWAHPALADGRLFVRDGKELICVQLPAKGVD